MTSPQPSILKRFSSSALSVFIARLLAFISIFGINAVLARTLPPAEFGIFALLYSITTLACLVASCGMNRALVKILAGQRCEESEVDNLQIHVRQLIRLGTTTTIVGGILVGSLAGLLAGSLLTQTSSLNPWQIGLAFGAVVFVRNLHFVWAETHRGFQETRFSNLYGSPAGGPIPHLLFLAILIVTSFVFGQCTLLTVLWIYLACLVITLPPLGWSLYCQKLETGSSVADPNPTQSTPDFQVQAIWALAIPLMLTQSFGLSISQADVWLAGAMVAPSALAVYCSAQRLLAFLTIPLQISGTAILPFIPKLLSEGRQSQLQSMIGLATLFAGVPGIVAAVTMLCFPEAILTIAFGSYYSQAAPILQVLAIGQLVCILTGPCENVLMMTGHQSKTLWVNIASATLIVALGIPGIIYLGIAGLAYTMASVTIFQNLFNWWLAKRLVGISTRFDLSYCRLLTLSSLKQIIHSRGDFHAA
ncbi:MAG: polysaccharide biosynthesis C-terminal domain-containing protein [Planctomycetota bacterium]